MKQLYFFDESERERILNLHESATKRQYIITEQETSTPAANIPGVTTTAAAAPDNVKIAMEKGYGAVTKEYADQLASQNWPAKPTTQQPTGWEKYPCVTKLKGATVEKLSGNSTSYKKDGVFYYNNGRKKLADGTMANYTCNDPEFKPSTTTQQPYKHTKSLQSVQTKLKEVDPNFSSTDTTKMDQATINKIYNLLTAKETPKAAETPAKQETPTQSTSTSDTSQTVD